MSVLDALKNDRVWHSSFVALLFAALFFKLTDTVADADLWGHLRFGADMLADGSVARTDSYSYLTSGQPWIDHEWLAEVVFAAVYSRAGAAGLIAFKLALALLLFVLLYRQVRRAMPPLTAAVLLAWSAVLLMPGLLTVRPQLFTYVLFTIELIVLDRAGAEPRTRVVWWLPGIFMVWASLHGGWIAGLGILLLWTLLTPTRTAVAAAAASVAATLVNPYGIGLWRFMETAIPARRDIAEWNPLDLLTLSGAIYLPLVAIGIIGLVRARRRVRPADIAIFIVAALLPLRAERHLPLFVAAALVTAGRARVRAINAPSSDRRGWIAALAFTAAALFIALMPRHFGCIRVDAGAFPIDTVALLKQSHAQGRLVVFYDWGEYAIWHLAPEVKVSIDGRRETVYSDYVYEQNNRFQEGTGDWTALLGNGRPDFVLTSPRLAAANLMKLQAGWRVAAEDAASVLFSRADLPPAPATGSRCFP